MKAYKHALITGVCMLWSCFHAMSQLCPSNALAPVFKQDFGQGTTATSTTAALSGSTNYVFGGVGTDGDYVLTPAFSVANKADWTSGGDHTGNTFGNMFLVNAGGGKSIFFKQTVTGLCSGSTFNFSAWLANANTPNTISVCGASYVYPNVIFNIKDLSGTVLATFNTGNLPLSPNAGPPNWQQYGFQFSLPNGTTSLVLEMVDYYGGAAACGNDLALDDILFTACTPQVNISLSTTPTICSGSSTSMTSTLVNSPFTTPAYQWQKSTDNGVTWNNVGTASTSADTYSLNSVVTADGALYRILVGPNVASLSSQSCVTASNSISLTVYTTPTVSLSSNALACTGLPLNLASSVTGGVTPYTYTWTGPNGFTSTQAAPVIPSVALTGSGVYSFTVTDANGCSAFSQTSVSVKQSPALTLTNTNAVFCTAGAVAIQASSSINGSLFYWKPTVVSGTASGYAANTSGTSSGLITDVITNVSTTTAGISYQVTTTAPSGCSATATTSITVYPLPGTANAGADQTLCNSTSALLNANNPASGTGSWSFISGPSVVSFANAASFSTTVSGLTTGTYQLKWTIANGVCADSKDTINIIVNPPTVAGTLSTNATVCANANAGALSLTGYTGTIIQWESSVDNGSTWSAFTNTTNSYSYTNLAATTLFRALVQSGPCTSQYSNIVTITVNPATVAGTLTANATVCANSNAGALTLTGNTGSIVQWESSINSGSTWSVFTNTTNSYSYTNLSATTVYRTLVKNGVCAYLYSSLATITVDPVTVAGTLSANVTVCANANAGTLSLTGNTGSILHWESSVDNGATWLVFSNTTNSYTYNNLSATTLFRALVQSGTCASQYSTIVTITIDPATVPGTLSANATVCAGANNGTLSLGGYTGNIVQWEFSINNGSTWAIISNTTNSNVYNNLTVTTLFRTLVKSGACASQYSNTVTITVDPATVGGTLSASATVCATANSGVLSLTGNTGSILQWESSNDNGTTWSIIANTTNSYTYTNLSATTLFRALVQSGSCASQYSNIVTITVNPVTVAGALSTNATVCANANNAALSLTGYTGNINQWESSSDNGTTWSIIANTTNTYFYNNLAVTTLFRTLVKSGVCASQYSNNVTITVNPVTVAGTLSADATVCANANSAVLSLTGYTGNINQWETSTDNGTTWSIIANTTNSYTYTNLSTTTLFRALVQSGVCTSQYSNPVTITVNPISVAGTLSANATVCANANAATLSLTGYIGNINQWESSTDNGATWSIVANTTNSYTYNNLAATTLFRVSVHSGVCASVYSNNITITVQPVTVAGTLTANATVCANANAATLSLTGYTGTISQWESSADNGTTWSIIANTTNNYTYTNLAITTLFRGLVQNGVCASLYSTVATITVNPVTVAGTLSVNATVCANANTATLSLTGYTGTISQWESSSDNGTTWSIITNTTNNYTYTNLASTTVFRALVQNGVCASQYSNIVTITVNPVTVAGILSASATVCANANAATLSLTGYAGNISQWESSIDNGATWTIIANTTSSYTYTNLAATTLFRTLIQNGVCAALFSNMATITVDPATVPGTISANATVCATANSGTLSLTGYTGLINQWESSIDNGATWSPLSNTTNQYTYNNLSATTVFRAAVQNSVCASRYTNLVTITLLPPVTIANAGIDQVLCNTSSTSFNANAPIAGAGVWSFVSGPSTVSFTNKFLPNTTVAGLTTGTYQFLWTISNTVCVDSKDTVNIIILPAIGNLIDTMQQTACYGQAITLQGQPATGGNGVYQYQWERSVDGAAWTLLAGAKGINYSFTADSALLLRRSVNSLPCSATSGVAYIFVQKALAGNSITGDQQICKGSIVKTIDGSQPAGGSGNNYQFHWLQSIDNGNKWDTIANAKEKVLKITSVDRTTNFKRIVATGLCNGALSLVSNAVTIAVKPTPQVSLQYKGGVYCTLNTPIDFVPIADNTDSIRWDFGDGTIQTTLAGKVTHTYASAGSYVPKLVLSNTDNCILPVTAKDSIQVDQISTGFKLSAINDCAQTNYKFTDTSQSYFDITKRIWTLSQSQQAVASGDNLKEVLQIYTKPGNYEAGLQVQTRLGCTSSLGAKFNVQIYEYPKANIDAISEACLFNLMEIKSVVNSQDSISNRYWNLGNGLNATDSVVKVFYYTEGLYTVKLTVGTINSCYDSAFKQLSLHAPPTLSLTSSSAVCQGSSIELKAKGALNYIWKDQNDNILCTNCSATTVSPQKNTQYKVVGYNEYGCSNIATTNVRVIQPLKLDALASDSMCAGSTKKIVVNGADNYSWLPTPGLSNYASGITYASPANTTTYKVIGKDGYNCFADTASIQLVVGRPSVISIGKDTTVISGTPIQLNTGSLSQDIRKWQWSGKADFSCVYCASPQVKVIMDENLICAATNQFGCITTDTLHVKTFCDGSEVFIPNAFTPDGDGVNDVLIVQGRGIKLIKSFRIYSRWGELVFEKMNFSPGDRSAGWDGKIRGKLANPDVFVYLCEAVCERGTPFVFKGNAAIVK